LFKKTEQKNQSTSKKQNSKSYLAEPIQASGVKDNLQKGLITVIMLSAIKISCMFFESTSNDLERRTFMPQ